MEQTPDSPPPAPDLPPRTKRPWWCWLLLFLPVGFSLLGNVVSGIAYRSGGGADGTHQLASGIEFGLVAMVMGLVGSVFLSGWEARNYRGRTPPGIVAIGVFICLQFWNLATVFAGCTAAQHAASVLAR